ncbi:MAG: hypothetical protein QF464_02640, partial [Myxococcota bacterium]|nr:hypothetical protein [Myxococcota bacterium]
GSLDLQQTPCSSMPLEQRVEALLFASERSLSETKMKTVLGIEDEDLVTNSALMKADSDA